MDFGYEGGTCEMCFEHYDDGDGKECPNCERRLCYRHYPMVGDPEWTPDVSCAQCRKEYAPATFKRK